MKQIELQLKELLGAKEYNRFAETVLYPLIEQLAKDGKLNTHDLARLAQYTKTHGAGIFDVWAADAGIPTRNSMTGSSAIIAGKRFGDTELKLFVKTFASAVDFNTNAVVQEGLAKHFKGTSLDGVIPEQLYKNSGKRVAVMPFIEGQTLHSAMTPENKEELLKKTLDSYLAVAEEVEHSKLFVPPKRNLFGKIWYEDFNLPQLQDFDKFFAKYFGADEELAAAYHDDIASKLNGKSDEFVHGDFHSGNVIVNGHLRLIDWEKAAWGFKEFDLYKLFTKSRVSKELEERLIDYAVIGKENLRRKRENAPPASKEELSGKIQESKVTYKLNQITQDLLTAERYRRYSEKIASNDPQQSERVGLMALVAYNLGLRHAEEAENSGMISPRFKSALESYAKRDKSAFHRVSDAELEELLKLYDPHTTMSKENFVRKTEDQLSVVDNELNKKHLKTIRKSLHKRDWKSIITKSFTSAALLGLASFAGIKYFESENARKKMETNQIEGWREEAYSRSFASGYNTLLEAELNEGLSTNYGMTRIPLKHLFIEDLKRYEEAKKFLNAKCQEKDIPFELVLSMYRTNACFAGRDLTCNTDMGLNLLDPYRVWTNENLNPETNLEYGLSRLSKLFDRYHVDRKKLHAALKGGYGWHWPEDYPQGTKEALTQFYGQEKGNISSRTPDEMYDDDLKEGRIAVKSVRTLVWNVMRGGPMAEDFSGGNYMDEPDKDFKIK